MALTRARRRYIDLLGLARVWPGKSRFQEKTMEAILLEVKSIYKHVKTPKKFITVVSNTKIPAILNNEFDSIKLRVLFKSVVQLKKGRSDATIPLRYAPIFFNNNTQRKYAIYYCESNAYWKLVTQVVLLPSTANITRDFTFNVVSPRHAVVSSAIGNVEVDFLKVMIFHFYRVYSHEFKRRILTNPDSVIYFKNSDDGIVIGFLLPELNQEKVLLYHITPPEYFPELEKSTSALNSLVCLLNDEYYSMLNNKKVNF